MVTPLLLWGLLDIQIIPEYEPFQTGFLIVARTDNPCHLWLRHTGRKPRKHYRAKVRRGLRTMKATYRCFVTYRDIEQLEAGDTLIHKFHFHGFDWKEVRYFYLRGRMTLLESRSQSALFTVKNLHQTAFFYQAYSPAVWGGLTVSYYRPQAQTFRPTATFDLSQISLRMRYYGFGRSTTIEIRDTTAFDEPGPNILSSVYYPNWPPDLIAAGMGLKWIVIPPVRVNVGTLYAIVLRGDGLDPWAFSCLWQRDFFGEDYPDGKSWNGYFDPPNAYWKSCPYPGGPWFDAYDHPFALYGNAPGL